MAWSIIVGQNIDLIPIRNNGVEVIQVTITRIDVDRRVPFRPATDACIEYSHQIVKRTRDPKLPVKAGDTMYVAQSEIFRTELGNGQKRKSIQNQDAARFFGSRRCIIRPNRLVAAGYINTPTVLGKSVVKPLSRMNLKKPVTAIESEHLVRGSD
ncbi:MAG TPA: hypothetical protein VNH18_22630 [Bryobacteraceae bacterium]|nr:hypothetical protein [Bryobacteraceae bacterium]